MTPVGAATDVALALLMVVALVAGILLVGAPVALLIRFIIEIAERV
jgi:hypothetical protein